MFGLVTREEMLDRLEVYSDERRWQVIKRQIDGKFKLFEKRINTLERKTRKMAGTIARQRIVLDHDMCCEHFKQAVLNGTIIRGIAAGENDQEFIEDCWNAGGNLLHACPWCKAELE